VAVKIETGHTNLLETEARFYKMLGNGQGIPKLHWFGVEGDFRAIVFGFLGPSLRDLLHYCGRPFSLKTVLMLADQLICRLRHIHSKKIIHCDVTPANCLMGVGREGNTVYLTDFGISHLYNPTYNPERGHMRGTVKFLSRNGQRGFGSCSGHQKCYMKLMTGRAISTRRHGEPWVHAHSFIAQTALGIYL
jgi:casein kinase I homolog HRR25